MKEIRAPFTTDPHNFTVDEMYNIAFSNGLDHNREAEFKINEDSGEFVKQTLSFYSLREIQVLIENQMTAGLGENIEVNNFTWTNGNTGCNVCMDCVLITKIEFPASVNMSDAAVTVKESDAVIYNSDLESEQYAPTEDDIADKEIQDGADEHELSESDEVSLEEALSRELETKIEELEEEQEFEITVADAGVVEELEIEVEAKSNLAPVEVDPEKPIEVEVDDEIDLVTGSTIVQGSTI